MRQLGPRGPIHALLTIGVMIWILILLFQRHEFVILALVLGIMAVSGIIAWFNIFR
jgi:hypothetical protein